MYYKKWKEHNETQMTKNENKLKMKNHSPSTELQ